MKNTFQSLLLAVFLLLFITSQAQVSIGDFNVYYGHLHNHCSVSDGAGTPDEAYNYARNTGKLDFFSLADHSSAITASEWTSMKAAADKYNQEGVFTALCGFEWTENVLGHVAVINSDNYITTASPANTFSGLCNWLNNNECVAFFNHPGRNNSTGLEFDHFTSVPTNKIVGMELWNKTDRFPVYYYTDGYYPNDGNKSWMDEAISRGWKIGASGSEDNHSGTWGTATNSKLAILATANNRTEIYNALKARRFFTTYDRNLALSFKIGGNEMGSTISGASYGLNILATDADGEMFTEVKLLKNGTLLQSWAPYSSQVNITSDMTCTNGEYYYIIVKQADGDEAISSPIWVGLVNQSPLVKITSPVQNSAFISPASISIEANATDPDGSIQKVEFYQGNTLLGEDATYPFSLIWTGAPEGTYQLTAKAFDNQGLSVISSQVQVTVTKPGDPVTVTSAISVASDDMEESSVGNIANNVNSTDIELVYDASTSAATQVVGLRFQQLNIPQGAVITSAYLQFTCDEISTGSCNLTISGEAADNSSVFTTSAYNISSRNKTAAQVSWIPEGWAIIGEAGSKQQTPDLSSIVQEIVSREAYTPTGAVSFIITGTGSRIAESYEGSSSQAAKLIASYTLDPVNNAPVVAITAPLNGSVYDAPASVLLTSTASDTDGTISKVEYFNGASLIGLGEGASYVFTWNDIPAGNYVLTARATDDLGTSTISSTVNIQVNGPNEPPVVGITSPAEMAEYTGPVSVVINVSATDPDGSIGKVDFYEGANLIGSDNSSPYSFTWGNVAEGRYSLTAVATDDKGATSVSSLVTIIVNAAPVIEIFSAAISTGSDDAEETAKGVVSTSGDDIELVYDTKTTGSQVVGLRFNGVTIPANSLITKAYIQFTVDEKTNTSCNLTIRGEKSSNAVTFSSAAKVSTRSKTTASVNWTPAGWQTVGLAGVAQQTADIKALVQEIVALPAWGQGNSMAFIITGTGNGKRTAVSYETAPAKAAKLYIEYQAAPLLKAGKIGSVVSAMPQNMVPPAAEPELYCYPVPSEDVLNVQLMSADKEKITSIEILDIRGILVKSIPCSGTEIQVELSGLHAGIYFVKVKSLTHFFHRKIVKN